MKSDCHLSFGMEASGPNCTKISVFRFGWNKNSLAGEAADSGRGNGDVVVHSCCHANVSGSASSRSVASSCRISIMSAMTPGKVFRGLYGVWVLGCA